MSRKSSAAAIFIAFLFAEPGAAQGPSTQTAQSLEVHAGIIGDIDSNDQLQWTRISCPAGQFAAGMTERQGGWTAQIGLLCTTPNPIGGWSGQPRPAGTAGGKYGNHSATLFCTRNEWITGMSGEMATAYYAGASGEHARRFLADPVINCGNTVNQELSSYADTKFSPEKPSGFYPTTYAQIPTQYCPPGTAVNELEVAVETTHHPDIKAVRLACTALPVSQPPSPSIRTLP